MTDWITVLREVFKFWWHASIEAFWSAFSFVGQTKEGLIFSCLLLVVFVGILLVRYGWHGMRERVWEKVLEGMAVAVIAFTFVFLWKLFAEPWVEASSAQSQLTASEEQKREAIIGRQTAELQREEFAKQPNPARCSPKKEECPILQTAVSQSRPTVPMIQGNPPQSQLERLVETDKHLPKGDRDRLADALFDFAQILDQANTAWGKANRLKVDENGPFLKDLATRKSKASGIESAAKEFEKGFYSSRQKWKYYGDQIAVIFGDDPDNHATILRSAVDEYSHQVDSVLALKDTDEANLKTILWPEDIRYDEAIRRFALWKSESEHRLEQVKSSLQ
jgi:hypothetical protein